MQDGGKSTLSTAAHGSLLRYVQRSRSGPCCWAVIGEPDVAGAPVRRGTDFPGVACRRGRGRGLRLVAHLAHVVGARLTRMRDPCALPDGHVAGIARPGRDGWSEAQPEDFCRRAHRTTQRSCRAHGSGRGGRVFENTQESFSDRTGGTEAEPRPRWHWVHYPVSTPRGLHVVRVVGRGRTAKWLAYPLAYPIGNSLPSHYNVG